MPWTDTVEGWERPCVASFDERCHRSSPDLRARGMPVRPPGAVATARPAIAASLNATVRAPLSKRERASSFSGRGAEERDVAERRRNHRARAPGRLPARASDRGRRGRPAALDDRVRRRSTRSTSRGRGAFPPPRWGVPSAASSSDFSGIDRWWNGRLAWVDRARTAGRSTPSSRSSSTRRRVWTPGNLMKPSADRAGSRPGISPPRISQP